MGSLPSEPELIEWTMLKKCNIIKPLPSRTDRDSPFERSDANVDLAMNDYEFQKDYVLAQLPGLLAMQDQNPLSPSFGCFHYAFWRDKVSEFSDARFQEAGPRCCSPCIQRSGTDSEASSRNGCRSEPNPRSATEDGLSTVMVASTSGTSTSTALQRPASA
jgi:hypothetical protein